MTTNDSFDGRLSAWLRDTSDHRVPDHLDEVLVATAATRQRKWWSSPEGWLPMTSTTFSGRFAAPRPLLFLLLIAGLLLSLVGLAIVAGTLRQRTLVDSGLAGNGRILAVDSKGALMSYGADGGDPRQLATLPSGTADLSISPDGERVAYTLAGPQPGVEIRRLADQAVVRIMPAVDAVIAKPVSWSPDGRFITFVGELRGAYRLIVVASDGSSEEDRTPAVVGPDEVLWRPTFSPDGSLLAFTTHPRDDSGAGVLWVMRPDGSGLRSLPTRPVSAGGAGGPDWAPDPAVHRIAYETMIREVLVVHLFDLDAGTDHNGGPGQWLSWSPDGSRIATCCTQVSTTSSILAGAVDRMVIFPQPVGGYCSDYDVAAGQSVCSRAVWSPDGKELMAVDLVGGGLLVTPSDGSGETPTRIPLGINLDRASERYVWQPIWP